MTPAVLAFGLLLQAAAPSERLPVLSFPEPGMDDTAAYQGYRTRLYRDSKDNAVQIYFEPRAGRVVQLWADAANESVGFTVRDARGRPARMAWAADAAAVTDSGNTRTIQYSLTVHAPRVEVGWFLLGSMRVERDFQYTGRHRAPFTAPTFMVAEESLLVANLARLPAGERGSHLALLEAPSVAALRARLQPRLGESTSDSMWTARVERPSLDGRNRLVLELVVDPRAVAAQVTGRSVSLRARSGSSLRLTIRAATDAEPLTPLARDEIFNRAFLGFLAGTQAAHDSVLRSAGSSPRGSDSATVARHRRLEREVRSVELLSSKEKLMAGLPNFATYFGRDMLMTALMMRPIWSEAMSEHVIASVLRKLGPAGDVSHEEALGGQAIRENAAEYNALVAEYFRLARQGKRVRADSALAGARELLRDLQTVRENYHMLDDEYQLPVLAVRYLADSAVSAARKRAFLLASDGHGPRLALLLRELALIARATHPYVQEPVVTNLVSFVKRDATHWRSSSWRDSDAGYAQGRFAMDINVIWVPRALEALVGIGSGLLALGFNRATLDSVAPEIAGTPLANYLADSASLRRAIDTWKEARRHFVVRLGPAELSRRIRAKLASLPRGERRYWETQWTAAAGAADSLEFLALSLDSAGRAIPVVNTDPATELFLADGKMEPAAALRELEPFMRPYPVGLLIERVGPVVANDAYASPRVWKIFGGDAYHSPRVVWGREVNLLLLGLAQQISAASDASAQVRDRTLEPYVQRLSSALERTLAAVNSSGVEHNELWSYRIEAGRLLPTRYGSSSDVQLWSSTDLAVQFVLSRLPRSTPP